MLLDSREFSLVLISDHQFALYFIYIVLYSNKHILVNGCVSSCFDEAEEFFRQFSVNNFFKNHFRFDKIKQQALFWDCPKSCARNEESERIHFPFDTFFSHLDDYRND